MTVIIGYIDQKRSKMYMAADSQASNEYYDRYDYAQPKIIKKGNMLVGFSGHCRLGQLVAFKFEIPIHPNLTMSDDEYMHTVFVDAFSTCLHKNKFEKVEDNVKEMRNNSVLIAYNGHLYEIDGDYSLMTLNSPFASTGCGSSYALGAMHILDKSKKTVETKLIEAVETAIKYSIGCGGKVRILSQEY